MIIQGQSVCARDKESSPVQGVKQEEKEMAGTGERKGGPRFSTCHHLSAHLQEGLYTESAAL